MLQGPLASEMVNFEFDSRNYLPNVSEMVYHYDTENQWTGAIVMLILHCLQ